MGTIYKRGETFWIKYYDGHGKPLYESVSGHAKLTPYGK